MDNILRVYTRGIEPDKYPDGLALSVHMQILSGEKKMPLNNDYGILFPKADIDDKNVIMPKYVGNISIAKALSGDYYITGNDFLQEGIINPENTGNLWGWKTRDFISYEEIGFVEDKLISRESGLSIEELRTSDSVIISDSMAKALIDYWSVLQVTEKKDDTIFYSDGSKYKLNTSNHSGLGYPLAHGFGDPVIMLWKDDYYFISTNDNENDIGLYVRKAHELEDLFKDDAKMYLILDKDEERGLIQTFWAPEFHMINGNLYIYFAVSNEQWGPQCHLMRLKDGGDILNPGDWMDPVKVKRADGCNLAENGITLDMTYVRSGQRHYYVWSYRENIGTELDSGSMLMVAEFSPDRPEQLISEPVCISRPFYGFENVCGTINNEGPYAFYHNNKIYLTYSGGDARGYLYTIGMLTANDGDDLGDIRKWEKSKTPVVHFLSVPGEYGDGHNSFFMDRNHDWWIAYHAVRAIGERKISTGIRRVHFDALNRPRFDIPLSDNLSNDVLNKMDSCPIYVI